MIWSNAHSSGTVPGLDPVSRGRRWSWNEEHDAKRYVMIMEIPCAIGLCAPLADVNGYVAAVLAGGPRGCWKPEATGGSFANGASNGAYTGGCALSCPGSRR